MEINNEMDEQQGNKRITYHGEKEMAARQGAKDCRSYGVHGVIKSYLESPLDWRNYDSVFANLSIPNPPIPIPSQSPMSHSYWLMYRYVDDDDDSTSWCFNHPWYLGDKICMKLPELSGSVICAAKYGWLLMSRACRRSLFFFNPFTKAKIELPQLPDLYFSDSISFSSPPTSADCTVFGVHWYYTGKSIYITAIARGQETWDMYTVDFDTPFEPSVDCSPVFFDGRFYCLSGDGKLGQYEPINGNWSVLNHPKPPMHFDSKTMDCFLLESDGKLLSVFMSDIGTDVSVFSLGYSRQRRPTWKKVTNLEDKMLWLSQTASFAAKAQVREMENKIFFSKLYVAVDENDRKSEEAVFYSLENLRYETFERTNWSTNNLCNLTEYPNCTWIEPVTDQNHSLEELDWLSNPS